MTTSAVSGRFAALLAAGGVETIEKLYVTIEEQT